MKGQQITYYQDILPIIETHCISCHRDGEIGPMPLTTYDEVAAYGAMLKYVTSVGFMPPWLPDTTYRHFENQRVLTKEEVSQIADWVQTGLKPGKRERAVKTESNTRCDDEPPDMIIAMSEAFEQYGIYFDQYQVFSIPTGLEHGKTVRAIEFVPGNPDIVRHCEIAIDIEGAADSLDNWDPRYGYYSFGGFGIVPAESAWYSWTPGQSMSTFLPGSGSYLPAHSSILMHIHYGPTGTVQTDSSYLKLWFTDTPVTSRIRTLPLINPYVITNKPFIIPANKVTRFHASFTVPYEMKVLAIEPQSLLLARSWEIFAVLPEVKESIKLIKIPEWDFKWRQTYTFQNPIVLPAGTVVHAVVAYDNTLDNPYNPAFPAIDMQWGKHMFQELMLAHFSIEEPSEPNAAFSVEPIPSNNSNGIISAKLCVKKPVNLSVKVLNFDHHIVEKIIPEKTYKSGDYLLEVSLNSLEKGNYYLEIGSSDGTIVRQLFIYFDPKDNL